MTQGSLDFDAPARRRPTLTDRLERHLRSRWGQWVEVTEMARVVGVSGVRQRRLECERRLGVPERREWTDGDGYRHLAFRWGRQQTGEAA